MGEVRTKETIEPQKAAGPTLWEAPSKQASLNMPHQDGLLSPGSRPAVRRLSSATANFADLHLGPSVVVPPKHMDRPSDAHETAAALEIAKHRLADSSTDGEVTPTMPPKTTTTDTYAFAFDIDGVLIRGGRPIPEAIEAMKVLNGQNEHGIKV